MAIRPRIRKRVQAVRRAADGSAFEKCEECGVRIAIALFDMHECGEKRKEVKRFKCVSSSKIDNVPIKSFEDEPRSPFVFFLEDFRGNYGGSLVEASRICFNVWKNMSEKAQKPFVDRATKVDLAHSRRLNEEARSIYKADDEADSEDVWKFNKFYECYDHGEDYSSGHEFWEDDTWLGY